MKNKVLVFWVTSLFVLIMYLSWSVGYRDGIRQAPSGDTIRIDSIIKVPVPSPVVEVPVPVPANVDTAAILSDYYTQRMYDDTLINDQFVTLMLRDTVYNNKLLGRTVHYNLSMPTIKVPTHEITVTGDFGYRNQTVMAGYKYKKLQFRAGYDFYNKSPMIGVGLTIARW